LLYLNPLYVSGVGREYNPMYQLVYDQQVMLHNTKPPDLHPQSQSQ
jgi:hypothetical protein